MDKYLEKVLSAMAVLGVITYFVFASQAHAGNLSSSVSPCDSGVRVKICNADAGVIISSRTKGLLCNVMISTGVATSYVLVQDSNVTTGHTVNGVTQIMPALFASSSNLTVSNLLGPVRFEAGLTCDISDAGTPAWIYYKPD